jgi:hypothetical protein
MKKIIAGLILLAIIAAFCIVNAFVCASIAKDEISILDRAQYSGDRNERVRILQEADDKWKKRADYLDCVMHHDDVDQVLTNLARLRQSSIDMDSLTFNTDMSDTKLLIIHISHSSKLALNELF